MKRLPLIIVFLALTALYGSFINDRLKFGSDAVDYVELAQSLRQGHGYTIAGQFNSKWPPLTSVVMAAGMLFFSAGIFGLKLINGLLALAGLFLAYDTLRRHYSPRPAWFGPLLAAVTFPFIYWVVDISSEPVYFVVTMAALWSIERSSEPGRRVVTYLGAGVLIGLAVLTRTIGWSLVLALGLVVVLRCIQAKSVKALPAFAAAGMATAVVIGAWYLYAWKQSGETSVSKYGSYGFGQAMYQAESRGPRSGALLQQVATNAKGYLFIFAVPDASLKSKAQSIRNPRGLVSAVIMLLALIGYLWHLARRPRPTELYLGCYGAVLMIFNWYDIRYLVPVLPFVFYYFAYSTDQLMGKLAGLISRPHWAAWATCVLLGFFGLGNLAFSAVSPQAKRLRAAEYPGAAGELHQASLWIKHNAPDAVIMCRWGNMIRYWTDMKVVTVPYESDPGKMWGIIASSKVTHVIADPDEFSGVTTKYLDPALRAHPEQVEQVATFGQTRVIQIRP